MPPMALLKPIPELPGATTEEEEQSTVEVVVDEQAVVKHHHGRPHPLKIQKLLRFGRDRPPPRRLPTVTQKPTMNQLQATLPIPPPSFRMHYNKIVGLIGYVLLFCSDEDANQNIRDLLSKASSNDEASRAGAWQDLDSLLDNLVHCNRRDDIYLPFSFEYLGGSYLFDEFEIQGDEAKQWKRLLNGLKQALQVFSDSIYQKVFGNMKNSDLYGERYGLTTMEINASIASAQCVSKKYQDFNPWRPKATAQAPGGSETTTNDSNRNEVANLEAEIVPQDGQEKDAPHLGGSRGDETGLEASDSSSLMKSTTRESSQVNDSTRSGAQESKKSLLEGEEWQSAIGRADIPGAKSTTPSVHPGSSEELEKTLEHSNLTTSSMELHSGGESEETIEDSKSTTPSMQPSPSEESEETIADSKSTTASIAADSHEESEETIEDSKSTTRSMKPITSDESKETSKDVKTSPSVQESSSKLSEDTDIKSVPSMQAGMDETPKIPARSYDNVPEDGKETDDGALVPAMHLDSNESLDLGTREMQEPEPVIVGEETGVRSPSAIVAHSTASQNISTISSISSIVQAKDEPPHMDVSPRNSGTAREVVEPIQPDITEETTTNAENEEDAIVRQSRAGSKVQQKQQTTQAAEGEESAKRGCCPIV